MRRERLLALLEGMRGARVAVIGDLFLDQWVYIDRSLDEPSLETGLTAYQVARMRCAPGAAGTVLSNLAALGIGHCVAISLIGEDGHGFELLRALKRRGIDTTHVLRDPSRVTPTYCKPMFLATDDSPAAEGHRLDFKNLTPTPPALEQALLSRLDPIADEVDAIVVLDQLTAANTGVITRTVREALSRIAQAHPSLLVYADSRAYIREFRHITVKCNDIEATGHPPDQFSAAAVFAAIGALALQNHRAPFITCGPQGVACMDAHGHTSLLRAARQSGPIDVCGAGDACSAGIVGALCAGASAVEAAFVGNLTSGVTVRKLGDTGTASPQEVMALYDEQFAQEA